MPTREELEANQAAVDALFAQKTPLTSSMSATGFNPATKFTPSVAPQGPGDDLRTAMNNAGASDATMAYAQDLSNAPPQAAPMVADHSPAPPGVGLPPAPAAGPLEDALKAANAAPGGVPSLLAKSDALDAPPAPAAPAQGPIEPAPAPGGGAPREMKSFERGPTQVPYAAAAQHPATVPKKPAAAGGAAPAAPKMTEQERLLREQFGLERERSEGVNRVAGEMRLRKGIEDQLAQDDRGKEVGELEEQEGKIREANEYVKGLKKDPNRFWANKDTGSKIAIGIGMMLGGALQGMGRTGSNTFADQLNGAIDRDLAEQQSMIDGAKTAAAGENTILGHMYQRFGRTEQARAAARISLLEAAEDQTKAEMAKYDPKLIGNKGEQVLDQLARERAAAEAKARAAAATALAARKEAQRKEIASQALDIIKTNPTISPDYAMVIARKNVTGESPTDAQGNAIPLPAVGVKPKEGAVEDKEKDLRSRYIPLIDAFANDTGGSEKIREKAAAAGEVVDLLRKGAALKTKIGSAGLAGSTLFESQEYKELDSIANRLRYLGSTALGQGVVRDHETASFDKMAGDLLSMRAGTGLAESNANRIVQGVKAYAKQYGVRPATAAERSAIGNAPQDIERTVNFEPAASQ